MKVCLITYADVYFRSVLYSFEKSKIDFCKNNSIDFIFESIERSNEKLSWLKIDLLLKYIKRYDVIIITDYDSVVSNESYDILSLLKTHQGKTDCICSQLSQLKLLGCSVWYNTQNTIDVLNRIRQLKIDGDISFFAEEAVFNEVLKTHPLQMVIDNDVNCIYDAHDIKNPFLLHYASIGNPFKIKALEQKRRHSN